MYARLLLDSRSWDLPMSYNPIIVTLSFLQPFFFNGLKKELCFSDSALSLRSRNPIRAFSIYPSYKPRSIERPIFFEKTGHEATWDSQGR
jgi:hypothetical protein